MKTHTTNYNNTFIAIADDSLATAGTVPPVKGDKQTVASLQFEIIKKYPYKYTSDEVLFAVYAQRNDLTKDELKAAREQFFSKGQPCFRASPLGKSYGWGVHNDKEGKIALYGCETKEYQQFLNDGEMKVVKAMNTAKLKK